MTTSSTNWKEPRVPRHVVQFIFVDPKGRFMVMQRSDKVRSAKNCWSFPSGMHEIGESIGTTIAREAEEEYGITEILQRIHLCTYENIAGDGVGPQYHWVISLYAVLVPDVTVCVNKEPDKHPIMEFDHLNRWQDWQWFEEHEFHHSFMNHMMHIHDQMRLKMMTLIQAHSMQQELK